MALFDPSNRKFVEVFSQLINTNPFLPKWVELERKALGSEFKEAPSMYSWQSEWGPMELHPNVNALGEQVSRVATAAQQRLADGVRAAGEELDHYEDLVLYHLYRRVHEELDRLVQTSLRKQTRPPVKPIWKRFQKELDQFFGAVGLTFPTEHWKERTPEHVFAWFFQLRRAFYHIYANIIGTSEPAGRLRGAVWQSIFTHDMRRWHRTLHAKMGTFPTLITGPSGTGKELVARAVGLSRYIPFDTAKEDFTVDFAGSFHPLNLSALAPTLIESELFGHKKGSFTGAIENRHGWLETSQTNYQAYGTVFLDEIGELDAGIQVKLLRVLQSGKFHRLGDSKEELEFSGKIISATNRDLAAEMCAGRFREDFYYRLCADRITTPTLREQLAKAPHDLHHLLMFVARREIGSEAAAALAKEVENWIDKHLGRAYPWPGNFRELEQCVRNIIIREAYEPIKPSAPESSDDPRQELAAAVASGTLTADELERRHFTLVYAQTDSFEEAARRLRCNWRTLRNKIDHTFLQRLKQRLPG